MSERRWRISSWQLVLLVFTLALCVTPFDLPEVLDPSLGSRSAWFAALPALGLGLWGTWIAAVLSRRSRGRSFDGTVLQVAGPLLGYPYLALLAVLLCAGAPANLVIFSSAAHAELLPRLPTAYVAVLAAAAGVYVAHSGPEAVGRSAEVLAPFFALGLAVIFAAPWANAHPDHLLPLSGLAGSSWLSLPVMATAGTIRGFLALLLIGPFCRTPPSGGRLCLAAGLAWALIALSLALPVAVFGAPLTDRLRFPFLSIEATVGWRWLPLRNIVSLTLLVWYGVTFVVFATYLWLGAWLLHRLVPRLPWTHLVVALGAASAAAGSLSLQVMAIRRLFLAWNIAVVLLGVLVPTLLWLAGAQRPPRQPARETAGP